MLVRRWAPFVERLLTGVGAVIPIWLGRMVGIPSSIPYDYRFARSVYPEWQEWGKR